MHPNRRGRIIAVHPGGDDDLAYYEKGTLWGHKRMGQSVATAQPTAAAGG